MMHALQNLWLGTALRLKSLKSDLENDERGVTAVEYAVMLVIVAIAIITLTPDLRQTIVNVFSTIESELSAGLTAAAGGGS